jgi:subfamily B ATP-binding cassette protein MsbA
VARRSKRYEFDTPAGALIKRLVTGYLRYHLGKIAIAVTCMVVVALMTGAQARLLEPALDKVLVEGDATLAWLLPLAYLAVAVTKGFASYGQAVLMQKTGLRVITELQNHMFGRLIDADLAFIQGDSTGKLIARFTNDVHLTRDAVVRSVTGLGRELATVLVLAGVMIHTNWRMAVFALLVFPLSVYPILYIGRRVRRLSADTQEAVGLQTGFLDEMFKGIRQVQAYGMEPRERDRAHAMFDRVFGLNYKAARTRARSYPILESLAGAAIALVIGWGGTLVLRGESTVGQFMTFFVAMLLAYQPLRSLANLNAGLQQGLAAAERVFRMIDYRPAISEPPDAPALDLRAGAVTLTDVRFAYDGETAALDDVTLEAPAGQTVALVGPSGAGKSTVLNLIPRFYDVQQGAVAVDGQDVRGMTFDSLRASMALVSQDVTLFNDTVRANIRYGRPDASDADIEAAARAAAADDFVRALPQGYDTLVGEAGVRLSGGQRQRIAIARAMLRDAPILLLDEATSALDAESERQVQTALARLMEGRTVLVIAHRLSTVMNADRIYVLDGGRVVDQGTHKELLAREGIYRRLCQIQFEDSTALATPDTAG